MCGIGTGRLISGTFTQHPNPVPSNSCQSTLHFCGIGLCGLIMSCLSSRVLPLHLTLSLSSSMSVFVNCRISFFFSTKSIPLYVPHVLYPFTSWWAETIFSNLVTLYSVNKCFVSVCVCISKVCPGQSERDVYHSVGAVTEPVSSSAGMGSKLLSNFPRPY